MFSDKIKVGHNVITVIPFDARRLYLDISKVAFINTETDGDGHIIMINLEDKITILKDDQFKLKVGNLYTVYNVNHMIINKKGNAVVIYSDVRTKTELFLLPLLGKSKSNLKYDSYFVSAKLDFDNKFLCLNYRFTGTDAYKRFEKYMMTEPLYISHLEYGTYQVTYIFMIPAKFENDVNFFLDGKYSKFSKALMTQIRKFYGTDSKPIIDIIRRDSVLREQMEDYIGVKLPEDAELASKPNLDIEIYKPYDKSN